MEIIKTQITLKKNKSYNKLLTFLSLDNNNNNNNLIFIRIHK